MTKEQPSLHVGIAEFSEPTFLLIGESYSFHWLAEQIAARRTFTLEQTLGKAHASLRFVPTTQGGHLSRKGDALEWAISVIEAQQATQQLKELAASNCPAHAYLDPLSNETDVQIVASIGEYDPNQFDAARDI